MFIFDVFDDNIDKYNNTVNRTIKMKLIDVTSDFYAEYNEDSNENILNLKLVIVSEYRSTEIFLLKDTLKICQKKFLLLVNLKIKFLELTGLVN